MAVGRGEQELDAKELLLKYLLLDFRRLRLALWGSIREPGMNVKC